MVLNEVFHSGIPTLSGSFSEHRLEVLDDKRFGPILLAYKPATENLIAGLEEGGSVMIKRSGEAWSQISLSEYMALLNKAEVETRSGVRLWMDIIAVLGRR